MLVLLATLALADLVDPSTVRPSETFPERMSEAEREQALAGGAPSPVWIAVPILAGIALLGGAVAVARRR